MLLGGPAATRQLQKMARRREHAIALTGPAALCSTAVPVFLSRATGVEGDRKCGDGQHLSGHVLRSAKGRQHISRMRWLAGWQGQTGWCC